MQAKLKCCLDQALGHNNIIHNRAQEVVQSLEDLVVSDSFTARRVLEESLRILELYTIHQQAVIQEKNP